MKNIIIIATILISAQFAFAGKYEENKKAIFNACVEDNIKKTNGVATKSQIDIICTCVVNSAFKDADKKLVEAWTAEELQTYVNIAGGKNETPLGKVKDLKSQAKMGFVISWMGAYGLVNQCPEYLKAEKEFEAQKKKKTGK